MSHLGERAADQEQDRKQASMPTGLTAAPACESLRDVLRQGIDLKLNTYPYALKIGGEDTFSVG